MTEYRVERDTMGEIRVPSDALWGAQTQRAVDNFPVSGRGLEPTQIHALAWIKAAAAEVNGALGVIEPELAAAIAAAATAVAEGTYDDQFPIDVFQTGSGTSSNMNMNEVVAALASARLDGRGCTRTTTSTPRSPPTMSSRPSIHLAAVRGGRPRPGARAATPRLRAGEQGGRSSRPWSRPAVPT